MSEFGNDRAQPSIHLPLARDGLMGHGAQMQMVGASQAFLELTKQLKQAAAIDNEPVLLVGERGSGKELAAQALHLWSKRRDQLFLPASMPALYEGLLADELFGHERNSFTGAIGARLGLFAAAGKGALFLDEIGDLSMAIQAALLRALETGEVRPVGADLPQQVDVRIVAATNRNLPQLIEQGKFRADLYDRLAVFEIRVPPLRERRDDVPALASHFVRGICVARGCAIGKADCGKCSGKERVDCITDKYFQGLQSYGWPGNVRELRSHMIKARSSHPEGQLQGTHLPVSITTPSGGGNDLSIETVLRRHIGMVLELTRHNLSEAAKKLQMSRSTLRNKIKKLGL